ncbi:hypothetical protein B0H10DRAFT_2083107 [Mycena sp. CBHHK59/15]|nr:hypothetical protein B0H10DRAFT_2083107 [Mycena sp. CBHHK59/15]
MPGQTRGLCPCVVPPQHSNSLIAQLIMLRPILCIISLLALAAAQTPSTTQSPTVDTSSVTSNAAALTDTSTTETYTDTSITETYNGTASPTGTPYWSSTQLAEVSSTHAPSAGAIAGVVIGAVVIITAIALAAFFSIRGARRARARTKDLESQVRNLNAVVASWEAASAAAAATEDAVRMNRDFTTNRDPEAEFGEKRGDVPPKYFD